MRQLLNDSLLIFGFLAIAAWFSPIAAGLLNPLTVLFSSVPVVALIPVIARLLGYDTSTVLAIVVIITFFPSFVFASSGLGALPPGSEDLFHVLGASRFAVLLRLAFLESNTCRNDVLDNGQLAMVLPFRNRLPRTHRDGWKGRRNSSAR